MFVLVTLATGAHRAEFPAAITACRLVRPVAWNDFTWPSRVLGSFIFNSNSPRAPAHHHRIHRKWRSAQTTMPISQNY